jgi:hypothetical protein
VNGEGIMRAMAILAAARFAYTVTLRRGEDGVWRGRADPADAPPHLVGDTPDVAIAGGMLTMDNPSPGRRPSLSHIDGPMASKALIHIGEALETVLHDEDVLWMHRGAMADVGLVLMRGGSLVFALGAETTWLRRLGIIVETDPRADDVRFYDMQSLLDQPDSQLVWLDPSSPHYESQLAELDRIPPHVRTVSIAARADDWATSSAVNRRAVGPDRRRAWGFNFERVDTRFQTRDDFIAHLRTLPKQRPNDLFLRFTVDGRQHEIREGESVLREPWLFCVCRVASPDDPWSSTHIGVARAHPALTADALRASARLIWEKHIQIERS